MTRPTIDQLIARAEIALSVSRLCSPRRIWERVPAADGGEGILVDSSVIDERTAAEIAEWEGIVAALKEWRAAPGSK